ncbi:uncharacterized protein METZ01_LOCUS242211, partial [marine metagenome]
VKVFPVMDLREFKRTGTSVEYVPTAIQAARPCALSCSYCSSNC